MLVSRKLLALIGFVAREPEAFWQWPTQRVQPRQCFRAAVVALDLEAVRPRDGDLDLIAFLKPERFHDGSRKPHGKAVAPFRDAHVRSPDIQLNTYITCLNEYKCADASLMELISKQALRGFEDSLEFHSFPWS